MLGQQYGSRRGNPGGALTQKAQAQKAQAASRSAAVAASPRGGHGLQGSSNGPQHEASSRLYDNDLL